MVSSGSPTLCEQLLFPTERVLVRVKGGVRVSSGRKPTETQALQTLTMATYGEGKRTLTLGSACPPPCSS